MSCRKVYVHFSLLICDFPHSFAFLFAKSVKNMVKELSLPKINVILCPCTLKSPYEYLKLVLFGLPGEFILLIIPWKDFEHQTNAV